MRSAVTPAGRLDRFFADVLDDRLDLALRRHVQRQLSARRRSCQPRRERLIAGVEVVGKHDRARRDLIGLAGGGAVLRNLVDRRGQPERGREGPGASGPALLRREGTSAASRASYLISSRFSTMSPKRPVDEMTQLVSGCDTVDCIRPTSTPRMKIVSDESPVAGAGTAVVCAAAGSTAASASPIATVQCRRNSIFTE